MWMDLFYVSFITKVWHSLGLECVFTENNTYRETFGLKI